MAQKKMTQMYNSRGQPVGFYENGVYSSERNFKAGQIFLNPKYSNAMALDVDIYEKLKAMGCRTIRFRVVNYEKHSFYAELTMKEFKEKSFEIDFDKKSKNIEAYHGEKINLTRYGKQMAVKMNDWRRVYFGQKTLEMIR